jgi:16S rRNA (guanine1516-N2)-methyltransferase
MPTPAFHTIVTSTTSTLAPLAQTLAQTLRLPFMAHLEEAAHHSLYLLIMTPAHLALQKTQQQKTAPFYIDFLSRNLSYRCQQASLRRERLARALGCHPQEQIYIVDATAGLGRDSFMLATLGFELTLLERSPILYALLQDAMKRASQVPMLAPIIEKMHLIHTDAIPWLQALSITQQPAIIYLDPMFPKRRKAALAKKDMQLLQAVLPDDLDSASLFTTAYTCAAQRIIVKRPRLAPFIMEKKPSFTLSGTSSRFDVYLTIRSSDSSEHDLKNKPIDG